MTCECAGEGLRGVCGVCGQSTVTNIYDHGGWPERVVGLDEPE